MKKHNHTLQQCLVEMAPSGRASTFALRRRAGARPRPVAAALDGTVRVRHRRYRRRSRRDCRFLRLLPAVDAVVVVVAVAFFLAFGARPFPRCIAQGGRAFAQEVVQPLVVVLRHLLHQGLFRGSSLPFIVVVVVAVAVVAPDVAAGVVVVVGRAVRVRKLRMRGVAKCGVAAGPLRGAGIRVRRVEVGVVWRA